MLTLLQGELGVLQMAISDALERAAAGEGAEGYATLLACQRRLDELAAEGVPGAAGLAESCRGALDIYLRDYCAAPSREPNPALRLAS
ncbi:MAG: hypothetical protein ACK47B_00940 [Armatimonadota bacterium]